MYIYNINDRSRGSVSVNNFMLLENDDGVIRVGTSSRSYMHGIISSPFYKPLQALS